MARPCVRWTPAGRLAAAVALVAAVAGPVRAAAQTVALPPDEVARLRAHHEHLVLVVRRLPARGSLADLVRPVMQHAARRSVAAAPDAENRAALIVLAFYVNGKDPARLIPEARTWPRAERRRLHLSSRGDLAQHFTMSAAIASAAGAPIAHVIGLYKELDDARRGGGFSFTDMAANRTGTTFGQAATASEDSARRLQSRITDDLGEGDIMPSIDGLPRDLREREFDARFRGANTFAYHAVIADIDRRIAALTVFATPD